MRRIFNLVFLLFILAGAANGIMDTLQFHYGATGFSPTDQFWNPDISWKNKYADWDGEDKSPAFFLSTTVFSFLTDGWHLAQTIMLTCFQLAVVIMFGALLGFSEIPSGGKTDIFHYVFINFVNTLERKFPKLVDSTVGDYTFFAMWIFSLLMFLKLCFGAGFYLIYYVIW